MDNPSNNDPKLLAYAAANAAATLFPDGPWCVTIIDPHNDNPNKALPTRSFVKGQDSALVDHILEWNGRRNIYLHANVTRDGLAKRASKTDIVAARVLFIDVDPPDVCEDFAAWKSYVRNELAALRNELAKLPKWVEAPSFVVDSGGGFQLLYRLAQPVELKDPVEFERYGRQLEHTYRGVFQDKAKVDSCHNVDRLIRFPGTENIPDAKKLAKGRQSARSSILTHLGTGLPYELTSFKPIGSAVHKADRVAGVDVPEGAEIPRIMDVAELAKWNVPASVQRIIVNGEDPLAEEKPGKDTSRSGWLFHAVCALVRCDVPDSVIYSLITDKDFGISLSVLECGGAAHSYAIRQIEQAREKAIAPELAEMNSQYAVVSLNGKTRVVGWVGSDIEGVRTTREFQTFEDFRNFHMNRQVECGQDAKGHPKYKPLGHWWLDHPRRRQYRGMRYAPGEARDLPNGYLNLFKGWGVAPAAGDWSLIRQHIFKVIAQEDVTVADYINKWIAWAFQNPGKQAEVALALLGSKGTGKGMFMRPLLRIFGEHGWHVTQQSHLVGNFNSHLEYCSLLFADEAFAPNDKQAESVMKTLITEPTLTIERKGVDVHQAPNAIHLVISSNDDWVIPATNDERRFAVFRVNEQYRQDHVYFGALQAEIDGAGPAAMLHDLLALDLKGWHPRVDVPQTAELAQQKVKTLRGTERVMQQILASGSPVGCVARDGGGSRFFATDVLLKEHGALGQKDRRGLGRELAMASEDMGAESPRVRVGGKQYRGRWLPPLQLARSLWAQRKSMQVPWAEPHEWEDTDDIEEVERPADEVERASEGMPF